MYDENLEPEKITLEIERFMSKYDTDKNGKIDKQEFLAVCHTEILKES
jgi:hypothetical protein